MIKRDCPRMVTLSPPCTKFSALQNLSGGPSIEDWREAVQLFEVAVRLAEFQARRGDMFMLEHPRTSRAWLLDAAKRLEKITDVVQAQFPMCAFGMTSTDEQGEGLVKKMTRVVTNSRSVAEKLARECSGDHRHVPLNTSITMTMTPKAL